MVTWLKQIAALWISLLCILIFVRSELHAQSSQYKRSRAKTQKTVKNGKSKSSKSKSKTKKNTGKLDIKNLEEKYWSPKDTDYTVVQNRTYTKAKKYSLSLQVGESISDTFSEGLHYNLAGNYFFTERHGIEFNITHSELYNSKATNAFLGSVGGVGGVQPDFGRITGFYGVSYNFVPFYAKMSLLGRKIMYFDMVISPGLGLTSYEQLSQESGSDATKTTQKSALTFTLDLTQFFFLTRHLAIRLDFKNRWFNEDVLTYRTGEKLRTQTTNTQMYLVGINWLF